MAPVIPHLGDRRHAQRRTTSSTAVAETPVGPNMDVSNGDMRYWLLIPPFLGTALFGLAKYADISRPNAANSPAPPISLEATIGILAVLATLVLGLVLESRSAATALARYRINDLSVHECDTDSEIVDFERRYLVTGMVAVFVSASAVFTGWIAIVRNGAAFGAVEVALALIPAGAIVGVASLIQYNTQAAQRQLREIDDVRRRRRSDRLRRAAAKWSKGAPRCKRRTLMLLLPHLTTFVLAVAAVVRGTAIPLSLYVVECILFSSIIDSAVYLTYRAFASANLLNWVPFVLLFAVPLIPTALVLQVVTLRATSGLGMSLSVVVAGIWCLLVPFFFLVWGLGWNRGPARPLRSRLACYLLRRAKADRAPLSGRTKHEWLASLPGARKWRNFSERMTGVA